MSLISRGDVIDCMSFINEDVVIDVSKFCSSFLSSMLMMNLAQGDKTTNDVYVVMGLL